jgi:hypothetical protein
MLEISGAPANQVVTWLEALPGIEETRVFGATVRLRVPPGGTQDAVNRIEEIARRRAAPGLLVRPVSPSLEDVFRFLLQPGPNGDEA